MKKPEIIEVQLTQEQHSEYMQGVIKASRIEIETGRTFLSFSEKAEAEFKELSVRLLGQEVVDRTWKRTEERVIHLKVIPDAPLAEPLSAR